MGNFYKNYKTQPHPHLALHHAKLDYLSDPQIAPDKKSPYYWASFVYYGGTEVPERSQAVYYFYALVLVAVVLLGLLARIYYRSRKRTAMERAAHQQKAATSEKFIA